MALYLVDTIVSYRIKYVVEAKELEHAFDEVTMPDDTLLELTQKCLGESIIEGREVTENEIISMLDTLKTDKNEMCSYWMGEKLINKVKYED